MSVELREKRKPIDIEAIVDAVPPYKEFKTGAELQESSKQLVKDFPELVTSGFLSLNEKFGTSTEGRNIELLTVGKGKKKAMWVGTPHPNEAVGTLAIDFLSRHLCEHPEITEQLDTTFVFIKNADPDGLELNKSWLKGDMDPLKYALGFYRPPSKEQVEKSFPVDYKALHFHNPSLEAQTLMKAFEIYKPEYYLSLHNMGFGNPYFNMSREDRNLFVPLAQVVADQGLTLSTGDPEAPFYIKYANGFISKPTVSEIYEYYVDKSKNDFDTSTLGGADAYEYLQAIVPHSFGMTSEVPYFTADALKDNSLSTMSRQDTLLKKADKIKQINGFMAEQFKLLNSKAEVPNSRFSRAVADKIKLMEGFTKGLEKESRKWKYREQATKTEVYSAIQIESFYESIQLGQVYRLALQAGEIKQAEEIKQYIEKVIDDINEVSPLKSVPLQKLVSIQVGAGLTTQQQLALAA